MAVGATLGAVAGGLVGKVAAESMSPTNAAIEESAGDVADGSADAGAESAYWRGQFKREPYYLRGCSYVDYAPAYLTGYLGHGRLAGRRYEDVEGDLELDYAVNRGSSGLSWIEAKPAIRAAWNRVEATQPASA